MPVWHRRSAIRRSTNPETGAFNAQLAAGQVRQKITDLGFEAAGGSAADYAKFVTQEIARWKTVVREANIHVDY